MKICPDKPEVGALLVDYPIPVDIAGHPEEGWKEIPDWDEEREKGNIRDTPYETSQALVYTYEKNNNGLWFVIGLLVIVSPIFIFDKRNLHDLLSGKYYIGFYDIFKKNKKGEGEKK